MKPYAVEARAHYITNNTGIPEFDPWSNWNTYKSITSMLQGLCDLRKNKNISYWQTTLRGKIVIVKYIWQYRPVHSNLIDN